MRWAILGTGYVSRKFVLGFQALDKPPQISVVASGNIDNARRFAADFSIPKFISDYDSAIQSADVDIVYVATPPVMHASLALSAIAAGKAVLVEKPFAMSGQQARQIVDAARERGVFCMEAMWTRFQPLTRLLKARIDDGMLGALHGFEGHFFGAERRDSAVNLFKADAGGGALYARGVYPVSLARHFLGPVTNVKSTATIGPTGVDEDCALILTHSSGAVSTMRASIVSNGPNDGFIFGSKASVHIRTPLYRPFTAEVSVTRPRGVATKSGRFEALKEGGLLQAAQQRAHGVVRWLRSSGGTTLRGYYAGNGYHYEAEEVMRAVASGATESQIMPLDESIEVMDILDAARADWVTGQTS